MRSHRGDFTTDKRRATQVLLVISLAVGNETADGGEVMEVILVCSLVVGTRTTDGGQVMLHLRDMPPVANMILSIE